MCEKYALSLGETEIINVFSSRHYMVEKRGEGDIKVWP